MVGSLCCPGGVPHRGHIATCFVHGLPPGRELVPDQGLVVNPHHPPPSSRHVRGLAAEHRNLLTGYLVAIAEQLAPCGVSKSV